MWHPVRGEALVSVSSIYNPHPPATSHSLPVFLWWFSAAFFKSSFTFRLPLFKNHFCVYLLCLPLSLPPFFLSLSLSACLSISPLSLCSVNLWQTLLPFSAWNRNSSTKFWGEKRKHIGKHHSSDVSLFVFDVFHLISLTSHLPLTKTSIQSLSHWAPLLIFLYTFGWQLQKTSLTRREEDGSILLHWHVYLGWAS